jgi:3-hydroxybutyrate dehydrogenase
MTTLAGKTALVTGSTSGIGLGIARALARRGANVLLNGFGDVEDALAAVRGAAAEHGGRVAHHGADVARPAEVEAMIRYADDVFGGVDILVNNAGMQHAAPVEEFAPDRWDAVLAINLSSAFHTTRLALPRMRRKGWGRIVNIASVHGLVASANKAAYVAAKHGLVGFTKVVALETARTNITCNAVCPGWVLTPLVQAQVEARAVSGGLAVDVARDELLAEKQPSGQFVTPEQLAELVVFLSSDAAAQVRGVAWTMDGAWTAQ